MRLRLLGGKAAELSEKLRVCAIRSSAILLGV
jgi:hypothetical protein